LVSGLVFLALLTSQPPKGGAASRPRVVQKPILIVDFEVIETEKLSFLGGLAGGILL